MKTQNILKALSFLSVLAVGCSQTGSFSAPRGPRLSQAMLEIQDKIYVRAELGEPDAILGLHRSAMGCTERWTYTTMRPGPDEVVFVDFHPTGHVCGYAVGAEGD